jgi:hypothetical protein
MSQAVPAGSREVTFAFLFISERNAWHNFCKFLHRISRVSLLLHFEDKGFTSPCLRLSGLCLASFSLKEVPGQCPGTQKSTAAPLWLNYSPMNTHKHTHTPLILNRSQTSKNGQYFYFSVHFANTY